LVSTTGISSTGQLTQNIELYNFAGARGMKVEGQTVISHSGSIESAKFATGMTMANFTGAISAETLKCPMLTGDAVVKLREFLVGAQVNYCLSSKAVASYSTGIALIKPEYKVSLKADEGFKTFTASYYQSVSPHLSIGYRALFNRVAGGVAQSKSALGSPLGMEIALKYTLNSSTFVKGKMDQKGQLQLAVSSVVSPGLRLVIGGAIDTKNLKASAHKTGINIVFEG
jgi:voltage-dependent anion channel protein 2